MTYQDRYRELMLGYEFLHVISHYRIIVCRIMGRIAMIPQILCQSALEDHCVLQLSCGSQERTLAFSSPLREP